MDANEFQIGARYRNRAHSYEVIAYSNDGLIAVLYDGDVDSVLIDAKVAARIHSNMEREEQAKMPRGVTNEADFAWTLGKLAMTGRLEVEVAEKAWGGFAHNYYEATGEVAEHNSALMQLISAKKWGTEARVRIPRVVAEHSRFSLPDGVTITRASGKSDELNMSINHNGFWWHLVRLGFRGGRNQDNVEAIAAQLPEKFRSGFSEGIAQ